MHRIVFSVVQAKKLAEQRTGSFGGYFTPLALLDTHPVLELHPNYQG